MGLKSDLETEVAAMFRQLWTERDGTVVPDDKSLTLSNTAVKLDATVLYADLADSTKLVDNWKPWFAAEMYKSFLYCAAKIIRSEGGEITAYDGDRIMAVFLGSYKNTTAIRTALKINYAAKNIVQVAKNAQYNDTFTLSHVVGIDTSQLFVAKTGVRGANDLVWVGRAANYAAKLAALPDAYATYITSEVYTGCTDAGRIGSDGLNMWQAARWDNFDSRTIYRSTYWWTFT